MSSCWSFYLYLIILSRDIFWEKIIIRWVVITIESLLPDNCTVCNEGYTILRDERPELRCKGCSQGFHQPCLVNLGLVEGLNKLPGSLYWLCSTCGPNYRLMTTEGGTEPPPDSKRWKAVPVVVQRSGAGDVSPPPPPPPSPPPAPPSPPRTKCSLPCGHTRCHVSDDTSQQVVTESEVRTETEPGMACPLFLKGECEHGISGKRNGICKYFHGKLCQKFMKWGNKHEYGCKADPCPKIHPSVCPNSLNLLCEDKECKFKLHIRKSPGSTSQTNTHKAKDTPPNDRSPTHSFGRRIPWPRPQPSRTTPSPWLRPSMSPFLGGTSSPQIFQPVWSNPQVFYPQELESNHLQSQVLDIIRSHMIANLRVLTEAQTVRRGMGGWVGGGGANNPPFSF